MKQLELQQQLEEQALLAASGGSAGKSSGPVRSRSGNDLASFNAPNGSAAAGDAGAASSASKYASAKSMPGSRRHSGEIKNEQAKDGQDGIRKAVPNGQQKDADGKPMLNSFLFDDELDADLQSASRPGPSACPHVAPAQTLILASHRLGLGRQVPPDEHGRRQVPHPRPPGLWRRPR